MAFKKIGASSIIMLFVFAIAALYLYNLVVTEDVLCTASDYTNELHGCEQGVKDTYNKFELPSSKEAEGLLFQIIRLVIIGVIATIVYSQVMKVGIGKLSRKDIVTIAILGIGIWLLWDKVLVKVWEWNSIDDITKSTLKKLGLG